MPANSKEKEHKSIRERLINLSSSKDTWQSNKGQSRDRRRAALYRLINDLPAHPDMRDHKLYVQQLNSLIDDFNGKTGGGH